MADTLSQVLTNNKATSKKLDEQKNLLGQILDVQEKQLTLQQKEAKQAAKDRKDAKRRSSDNPFSSGPGTTKKGSGGDFLKNMAKDMKGLFKGLGGAGGWLMKALGLTAGVNFATMLIDRLLPKNGKGLMSRIMQGLFGRGKVGEKGVITSMLGKLFGPKSFLGKIFGKGGKIGNLFKGKGLIKGGGILSALTAGIMEYFESGSFTNAIFSGGGAGAGAVGGGILGSFLGPIGTVVGAALGAWIGEELGNILKEQLDKNPWLKGIFDYVDKEFKSLMTSFQNFFGAVQKTWGQFTDMVDVLWRSLQRFNDEVISPFFKSVGNFFTGVWKKVTDGFSEVAKFLEPITKPLKELATKIIDPLVAGLKGMWEFVKPFLNPAKAIVDAAGGGVKNAGNFFGWIADGMRDYADGKQLGGFVGTVPNQGGNGDRFGAMLSPGSVVLNQTAAGMMQNGGMVPTMLEQGEQVFGPGNPAAGHALMMNSMIPRFQTGGVVQTKGSSQTGSGWQPKGAKDYKGRPVVLSEGGAEAFAKMVSASNGAVKGSDVTSSKRSTSWNSSVGGVNGSNHLYGNGLDINSGSSSWQWMRQNSGKYGWHWNDYLGQDGWHWDYTGKKSKGTNPDEGNENGIAKIITSTVKGALGAAGSMMSFGTGGKAGMELLGAIGTAFSNVFGDTLGDIFGFMGGGGGGGAGGGGGGATGAASGDMKKGAEMLMKAGIPKIGAAYLAGNIQQESGWNGQRDWGQVMGDGTSRNGGLVSWASWKNDPARLGKIEKHLGKNIKDASDAEQVNAMLWEMKRDYPGAHSTFMNPNSSAADLRRASKSYWGYGHEGSRYAYADQAHSHLKGMQKGGVANMRGSGNEQTNNMVSKSQDQLAQKIAAASTPVVVPIPSGDGGPRRPTQGGNDTVMPDLPIGDSSIIAMEYKYRITMGASV